MLGSLLLSLSLLTIGASSIPLQARQWTNSTLPPAQDRSQKYDMREVITHDFPDPAIYKQGSTWYAFSTASAGINTQVATSPDFKTWTLLSGHDAFPTPGSWVDSSAANIWAPDVFRNNAGLYVLYYSGALASSPAHHCIGIATSHNIEGPYIDYNSAPAICPQSQGGAIDPAHFRDNDGTRYILYKIDGNSIGNGGDCGNSVAPIVSTPIMLQRMSSDGFSSLGNPVQILTNNADDGPLVEAPSLSKTAKGEYMLLFSSGCYSDPNYNTKYALAQNINGPYARGANPVWATGVDGLDAPGGASAAHNGAHAVFHAGPTGSRSMWTAMLHVDGQTVDAF